jgi:hypothetical protein
VESGGENGGFHHEKWWFNGSLLGLLGDVMDFMMDFLLVTS